MAEVGHNSTRFAKDQLKAVVERIERLQEEKKTISDDIRDVYAEAKGNGFDVKALREIIKRRTWDRDKLANHDALVETYMEALGMLVGTPLGDSAIERLANNPKIQKAIGKLGTPVEPTDAEIAKGVTAAFVGKDGTRMSIAPGKSKA